MSRILLTLIMVALFVPLRAQTTTAPLSGLVTLTVERGMFYINLGMHDQVNAGAIFAIECNGAVVARAQAVKVSFLDTILQLVPENRNLQVSSDMRVVMQQNGPTACRAYQCRLPGADVPAMEPDMSINREEREWGILALGLLAWSVVK